MKRYLDLLGGAAALRHQGQQEYIATVTALWSNGAVNLLIKGGALRGVPAIESYQPRAVGDKVIVRVTRAGWYVVGKTGSITTETVADAVVPPDVADSWLSGVEQSIGYAIQGGKMGKVYTGAWFYGTALRDAIIAGSGSANIELTRRGTEHGSTGPVLVKLHTHSSPVPGGGAPTSLAGPWDLGTLERGQTRSFPVPEPTMISLATASARGLMVNSGTTNYLEFAAGSGTVYVDYV